MKRWSSSGCLDRLNSSSNTSEPLIRSGQLSIADLLEDTCVGDGGTRDVGRTGDWGCLIDLIDGNGGSCGGNGAS